MPHGLQELNMVVNKHPTTAVGRQRVEEAHHEKVDVDASVNSTPRESQQGFRKRLPGH